MRDIVRVDKESAERIKKRREELSLPQRALAKLSGLSPAYIAKLEAGHGLNVTKKSLLRLAVALGVMPGWILGGPVTMEAGGGPAPRVAMAFGEVVQRSDGETGASWLRLLWEGSIRAAANPGPGPEGLQAALRTVASAAQAARKFIPADRIGGVEDDFIGEDDFLAELWNNLEPLAAKRGWPEEQKLVVMELFKGGKGNGQGQA